MVCRIAEQSRSTSCSRGDEKKSAAEVWNEPQDFAFGSDDLQVMPRLEGNADRHDVDHAWMVGHCEHRPALRNMPLACNVSAAGEFVQYVASGSREPVLAHEIVEPQNLTRKS